MRSPPRPRVSSSFRPRFGGRFFRPRFMRDDHVFRKPRLSLGFQRYNSFSPRPRFTWREQPGSTGPDSQYNNQRNVETNSPTRGSIPKKHTVTGAVKYSAGPSRNVEKQPVSFKVYRQDCDTFGVVVKMLVAKDPSLERPIQSSLQENLRDIGLRCVEAMQQFIEDYDTREPLPL
ncbi:uncharacterized protein LOC105028996 isoform X2 [Esox lucius]|nr:uncharacterized protein LOC105028996 isoform X2 [Esox lucius]XP_034151592.1 uncharacterized protein LOC105028996 isoform X2 [Esox lucius]XP_034151593.1 uncharacterized protein LOC105028996 isoform X2 [Esox lucius]